ncbi:MAG: OsmC family protein [Flavobacteriales bacterium]|nr:OsmC family protein [Flavobacteriales bacterium]MBP6642585.1 OsmC family protein [Flavobacteriales bacterium]MBP7156535.1 OsmC family protein [Flavobacteriales bacterium]HQV74543.1 bifunctional alpha/beta hydrolase/OsmC family protein [Flavobacteriales bacterium]HQW39883.1 bifunctional alpha/beta hydrolase/OsmC family protein [Flavobacteriales bacterium]
MKSTKITFTNATGLELSARLDLPADRKPQHFALFAHCFTCSKDLSVVRNISRALTSNGFGVMRFDFAGLGDSDGAFSETTFSSNIEDVHAAMAYLAAEHKEPELIIGHSLGGAAAIVAGAAASHIKAIATIGAPAHIDHIKNMFTAQVPKIMDEGSAQVSIGGRPFTISRSFLEDLGNRDLVHILADMRKAILIAHSPQDTIVSIDNAAELYQAARHPKTFLSLDGADHLLTNSSDSIYVGNMIASWVQRYLPMEAEGELKSKMPVVAHIANEGFTTQILAGGHPITADEPESVGGNNYGPSPYDLLSAALGACTAMTMKMYAERKQWDLQEAFVHLRHGKVHATDCAECEEKGGGKIDRFERLIELHGDLDETQRKRLVEIADKCPVHRTLHETVQVVTWLKKDESV